MKKYALIFFTVSAIFTYSQTSDSLSWYRNKVAEMQKNEMQLKDEYSRKEAAFRSELEEKDKFTKTRIEKLQTVLITSYLSSLFVMDFCFYVLKKKKTK